MQVHVLHHRWSLKISPMKTQLFKHLRLEILTRQCDTSICFKMSSMKRRMMLLEFETCDFHLPSLLYVSTCQSRAKIYEGGIEKKCGQKFEDLASLMSKHIKQSMRRTKLPVFCVQRPLTLFQAWKYTNNISDQYPQRKPFHLDLLCFLQIIFNSVVCLVSSNQNIWVISNTCNQCDYASSEASHLRTQFKIHSWANIFRN